MILELFYRQLFLCNDRLPLTWDDRSPKERPVTTFGSKVSSESGGYTDADCIATNKCDSVSNVEP